MMDDVRNFASKTRQPSMSKAIQVLIAHGLNRVRDLEDTPRKT